MPESLFKVAGASNVNFHGLLEFLNSASDFFECENLTEVFL